MKPSILIFIISCIPSPILSCAVCFGDPESPVVKGMNNAIIFLLCTTVLVLSTIAYMIFSIRRRSMDISKEID